MHFWVLMGVMLFLQELVRVRAMRAMKVVLLSARGPRLGGGPQLGELRTQATLGAWAAAVSGRERHQDQTSKEPHGR